MDTDHLTDHIILPSCIRGYYIYNEIWTEVLREELMCKREPENSTGRYAVAVSKNDETVGHLHVPRKISQVCLFV